MRVAIITLLVLFWVAVVRSFGQSSPPAKISQSAVPESGFLCSGKYTNAFLGFSLPLPKDGDLKVFSDSLKGPALSRFLVSFASGNGKNTLVITAKTLGIEGEHQAQYEAAGPEELGTKKIQIAGNTFWRSESNRKTRDGELQSLTFATERKGHVLAFYIVSFDAKFTAQMERSVQALVFFDEMPPQKELDEANCKVYNPSLPESSSRISRLSDGVFANHAYYNSELGFHYQIPDGWTIYDKATQEGLSGAGTQFIWRSPFAESEHTAGTQCTKNLLLATQYADGMRLDRFNSVALVIAVDPGCLPGVNFPASVEDRQAIQRIAGAITIYFKTPSMNATGPAKVRAFNNAGRVMLEISQPFSLLENAPRNAATDNLRTSLLLMQAGDYWVIWMFASDSDATLEKLRATKIFFNDTPGGSPSP